MKIVKKIVLVLIALTVFGAGFGSGWLFNYQKIAYLSQERNNLLEEKLKKELFDLDETIYSLSPEVQSFLNSKRVGIIEGKRASDHKKMGLAMGMRFGPYVLTVRHALYGDAFHFLLPDEHALVAHPLKIIYRDSRMDLALLEITSNSIFIDLPISIDEIKDDNSEGFCFFRAFYTSKARPAHIRLVSGTSYPNKKNIISSTEFLKKCERKFGGGFSLENAFAFEGNPQYFGEGASGSPVLALDANMRLWLVGLIALGTLEEEIRSTGMAVGVAYKISVVIERIKINTGIDLINYSNNKGGAH